MNDKMFSPFTDEEKLKLKAAKKRVIEMDEVDGCSVASHGFDLALRTVITALAAGSAGEPSSSSLWCDRIMWRIWRRMVSGKSGIAFILEFAMNEPCWRWPTSFPEVV